MYMNTAVINLRTDKNVKLAAQRTANELGLNLSAVMNGFLRDFVKVKSISFSLAETPSPWLIKQIRKAEDNLQKGLVSPVFEDASEAVLWLNNPRRKYAHDLRPEVYKAKRKSS